MPARPPKRRRPRTPAADDRAILDSRQLQDAIYRIAQAAITVTGVPELMLLTHQIVGELLPAQNYYIALYDAPANRISFPYWADERQTWPEARTFDRGLTEFVLRTGAPQLVTPDVHRRLEEAGEIRTSGVPAVDWIGIPLKVEDRTIGVMVVQTYSKGVRYGEREKDILTFVSSQIAMAIERKRVEEQLRESENRYRMLFEFNPEAMWVYDAETLRMLAVNDAAIRRYGYSRDEFLSMTIRDVRPAAEQEKLDRILRLSSGGPRFHAELRHRVKDGSLIDVEIATNETTFDGRPARLVLISDVTHRKQLETHFRHAQKMEAVGQLAGGIAHDFNNLLTAITGYTDLLIADLPDRDPRRHDLEGIRGAAGRAARLTQQLLAFSRKQVLQPRVLDLNDVVIKVENLLRRLVGEHVVLTTALDPGIGPVEADPAQIEQVIINLTVNARDAMVDGGQLVIETTNSDYASSYTAEQSITSPAGYVQLIVSDTGTGMDDATKARLFEPFFTTKGPGKGTGLGLSTVYGIVKQSGGFVGVHSELGRGTVFKIYLPRVSAPVEAPPVAVAAPESMPGAETVLLVEDESALRAVARRVLERHGYTVLEAGDGREALEVAANHGAPIDLVISDVVMPVMGGPELSTRFATIYSRVPFLFISGYTDDAIGHHGVLDPGVDFLQKPFSAVALAKKVREVLDGSEAVGRG